MLSIPIINTKSNEKTRPVYLAELKRAKADRVFIFTGHRFGKEPDISNDMAQLAENVTYYRQNGLEAAVWINGFGHGGPRDPLYGEITDNFQHIVGLGNGGVSEDSFCPLDDGFSGYFAGFVKQVAESGTKMIMIDDDLRMAIHGNATVGCACPLHVAEFSKRIGRKYTREEIAARVFTGNPCREREVWLKMQGDTMRGFLGKLRASVDGVDTGIRLGFCACMPTWDLDGIDSIEMSKILAGNTKPFLRLIGAAYWNVNHNFGTSHLGAVIEAERMEAEWCRKYAPEIEIFSEGDVFTRPRYKCPSVFVEDYDQILEADGRLDGILKYMIDYYHAPLYETGYIDRHVKLEGLRWDITASFSGASPAGVYVHENMHKLKDADCSERDEGMLAAALIPPAGRFAQTLTVPTTYEINENTKTAMVFGANAYDIAEIPHNMPLVLDAAAAVILADNGADVGIKSYSRIPVQKLELFPDGEKIPLCGEMKLYGFETSENVRILSAFDNNSPASLVYTDKNGRDILIYAFAAEMSDPNSPLCLSYERQRTLSDFLQKHSALPARVDNQFKTYMLCKKTRTSMTVGLWNFAEEISLPGTVKLDGCYSSIEFVGDTKGQLISKDTVRIDSMLYPYQFAGFKVTK